MTTADAAVDSLLFRARMPTWLRGRLPFVGFALAAIAAGLVVHGYGDALSPTVRDVLGDALWAAMLTAWVGALNPSIGPWRRGMIALGLCALVELSQRYHTPALDTMRQTTFGHLVLGSDYDVRDLGAYALGVLSTVVIERLGRRRQDTPQHARL
jgi:hypothetical protein